MRTSIQYYQNTHVLVCRDYAVFKPHSRRVFDPPITSSMNVRALYRLWKKMQANKLDRIRIIKHKRSLTWKWLFWADSAVYNHQKSTPTSYVKPLKNNASHQSLTIKNQISDKRRPCPWIWTRSESFVSFVDIRSLLLWLYRIHATRQDRDEHVCVTGTAWFFPGKP